MGLVIYYVWMTIDRNVVERKLLGALRNDLEARVHDSENIRISPLKYAFRVSTIVKNSCSQQTYMR